MSVVVILFVQAMTGYSCKTAGGWYLAVYNWALCSRGGTLGGILVELGHGRPSPGKGHPCCCFQGMIALLPSHALLEQSPCAACHSS